MPDLERVKLQPSCVQGLGETGERDGCGGRKGGERKGGGGGRMRMGGGGGRGGVMTATTCRRDTPPPRVSSKKAAAATQHRSQRTHKLAGCGPLEQDTTPPDPNTYNLIW